MKSLKILLGHNQRSVKQYRNVILSLFYKAGAVLSSFLTVPICLSFLSTSEYGIWLVIFSVMSWTTFFDLGLGNGLKNRLSAAIERDDKEDAQRLVSTNYVLLSIIASCLILLYSIMWPYLNWATILNADHQQPHLGLLVWTCLTFFVIKMVLDSINSILMAYQEASFVNLINFISGFISLIGVSIFTHFYVAQQWRLWTIAMILTGLPVMTSLGFNIFLFATRFKHIYPSRQFFHRPHIRQLSSIGGQFFLIQIAALVVFSTDSILITRLFGPAQVTVYNITYKFFSSFTIVWGIVIAPYWVAFCEAYIRNDYAWIRKTVTMLIYFWIILVCFMVAILPFAGDLYMLWVGHHIYVPTSLSISMVLFVALSSFSNIFAYFVNGLGKIQLQVITSFIAAAVNIPLAIYFSENAGLGLTGIVLAGCVSVSIGTVLITIQYYKIINFRALGVWNK